MNDHDLGPALRDRVGDVHPDLDRLAATSLRAGTRIRRRRTIGVSLAAAAGVAAVAGVAWQLTPGTPQATELGFAAQPSATPTPTLAPEACGPAIGEPIGRAARKAAKAEKLRVIEGAMPPNVGSPDAGSDTVSPLVSPCEEPTSAPMTPQALPVHHDDLPGWTFGTPGDDKFPANKGDYAIGVVVRSLDEWSGWNSGDPDHPSTQIVHKGGNYFVTVQPNPDVPKAVVDELVAGLHFDATWDQTTQ